MLNKATLIKLIQFTKSDEELSVFIDDCLLAFSEYAQSIYDMETKLLLKGPRDMERDVWQHFYTQLDETRRSKHNRVIGSIRMLNRLAEKVELPPFYEGIVSEEKPYRRMIADEVLEYVSSVIKERR